MQSPSFNSNLIPRMPHSYPDPYHILRHASRKHDLCTEQGKKKYEITTRLIFLHDFGMNTKGTNIEAKVIVVIQSSSISLG